MVDWPRFISQYDLIYETPPSCWQDGFVLGNGSLGAVFYAPEALEWLVNKTDVLDARVPGVKRIIPPDEAAEMVRNGARAGDFEREERGLPAPLGMGPKTCCSLTMDLGMASGSGTRSALPSVHSRLSLYDATLRIEMDKHLCHPRVESFVKADEDILVIRVRDVSPLVAYRTNLFFSRPEDVELGTPELRVERDRLVMTMDMPESASYVVGVQIIPRVSTAYRQYLMPRIRQQYHPPVLGQVDLSVAGRFGMASVTGDFDVLLTVVTDRDAQEPVAEMHSRLDRLVQQDYVDLRTAHESWWREFWQKSWIELGDKALEQMFYHSLYTLGSSYRKAPIPGLLGLCYGPSVGPYQISPWAGDLHHDLNVQCPFLPVHVANHSELFDAYLDTYESFLPAARKLAKDVWGVGGAHFDMGFNAAGRSVFGSTGNYRYFFGGSYIALMHCLCWQYKRDVEQLGTKIYPFLTEVLEFYLQIMKKGEDGRYHLRPAHAAELNLMDVGDPVQVISMLRVCLQTALEASEILGIDKDFAERWADLLAYLPEYPTDVDSKGRRVVVDGVGVPADHHVGQAGCLHPVYPCGEIDEFSEPEVLALYNDTLDSVVEKTAETTYACEEGFHYKCVWQCFFRAMTALRLGRAGEFWDVYLPMMIRAYSKPNGLFSHDAVWIAPPDRSEANLAEIPDEYLVDIDELMPKFEPWCGTYGGATPNVRAKETSIPLIEAGADYMTMILETLLQSHSGVIRVFPGWDTQKDAQFCNLIAEGNIAVSSRMNGGMVDYIKLESRRNEMITAKVKSPWTGQIEALEVPANGQLILTPEGMVDHVDAQPNDYEDARPRVIYQDDNVTLWLGRKDCAGSES